MAHHVYCTKEAVKKYNRSHGLVKNGGSWVNKAKVFFNGVAMELNKQLGEEVSVLDIGVGHGGWFFIPLIISLRNSCEKRLKAAVGIDNSKLMIQDLINNIGNHKLNYKEINLEDLFKDTLPTDISVINADIEQFVYEWDPQKNPYKFDVVILMGFLHHTINWRQTLSVIVNSFLCPDSFVVIAERNFDSSFLDGNFYRDIDKNTPSTPWRNLWLNYYKERGREGFPWVPELRISDYDPVLCSLLEMNFVIKMKSEKTWFIEYKKAEISQWLEEPVFSNFYRSLNKTIIDKLKKTVSIPDNISVCEGWRIYILKRSFK